MEVYVMVMKSYQPSDSQVQLESFGLIPVLINTEDTSKAVKLVEDAIADGAIKPDCIEILWDQPNAFDWIEGSFVTTGKVLSFEEAFLMDVQFNHFDGYEDNLFFDVNPLVDAEFLEYSDKEGLEMRSYLLPDDDSLYYQAMANSEKKEDVKPSQLSPLPDPLPLNMTIAQLVFIEKNLSSFAGFLLEDVISNGTALFENSAGDVVLLKPNAQCKLINF